MMHVGRLEPAVQHRRLRAVEEVHALRDVLQDAQHLRAAGAGAAAPRRGQGRMPQPRIAVFA
jgi:hypothetical protein